MKRPNILLITIEELRGDFPGYAGCKDAETPFIDKLASESVTFSNHFTVHSKCVPSRAAWFSGRYPHVDGHRTLGIQLQENEINLAKELKKHGYKTIIGGKNHVVEPSELHDSFDEFWTRGPNEEKCIGPASYIEGMTSHSLAAGNKYADNYISGKLNTPTNKRTEWLQTEKAIEYFNNNKDENPFFINLNYQFTHTPYNVMEPYYSRFMNKELTPLSDHPGENKPEFVYELYKLHQGNDPLTQADRDEMKALYLGMLAFVDDMIKKTIEGLEAAGLRDDTMIIVTSDHGDFVGQYGLPEKWDTIFHDCLINVPLIISYPGFEPRQVDALCENIDCMPTILEGLGIPLPYGIQGESLMPLILGEKEQHKEYVFAEGGHEPELLEIDIPPEKHNSVIVGYMKKATLRNIRPESLCKSKMIRTKDKKLVYRTSGEHELYDLVNDPEEMHNIYNDPEQKNYIADLTEKLLMHLIKTEQNLPLDPRPIA